MTAFETADRDQASVPTPPLSGVADKIDQSIAAAAPLSAAIVQAKLSVGPAGDRYEVEADAVADRVVQSMRSESSSSIADAPEHSAQRRMQRAGMPAANVAVDHQRVQRKAEMTSPTIGGLMPTDGAVIQRVMTADALEAEAAYIASQGDILAHLDVVVTLLRAYELIMQRDPGAAAHVHMIEEIQRKLWDPVSGDKGLAELFKKSQDGGALERLVTAIDEDLDKDIERLEDLETPDPLGEEQFNDGHETSYTADAVSGGLNNLAEVTYDFGTETDGFHDQMNEGSITGFLKSETDVDSKYGRHRGSRTGIPEKKPQFGKRSVASYALDKLLGADLVPPTFWATHGEVKGILIEKVAAPQGGSVVEGKDAGDNMNHPIVRRGLSNLTLLDYIAGQVDRHPGNYMIVRDDTGTVIDFKAIDNDLAFGPDYLDVMDQQATLMQNVGDLSQANTNIRNEVEHKANNGLMPSALTGIDQRFAEKVVALGSFPELIDSVLDDILSIKEVVATRERLTKLADFLRPLLANDDARIKAVW